MTNRHIEEAENIQSTRPSILRHPIPFHVDRFDSGSVAKIRNTTIQLQSPQISFVVLSSWFDVVHFFGRRICIGSTSDAHFFFQLCSYNVG